MLELFRKYQSYIYLVVTVVIVISFSFFGTYSTMVSNPVRDQVVFTAIDGEQIKHSQLEEMVVFISTDSQDKQLFGGMWGFNFLNDGVIRKDFLETGLAGVIAASYLDSIKTDLESRYSREKAYVPYKHPQAKFISLESVWEAYAPKINQHLEALKDKNHFNDRVSLFLEEKKFPAPYARYVLNGQEKQFNFVSHDPNLDRLDLSLFGYHSIDDWFGPKFIKLIAEVIINGSKVATEKGYVVSKEEVIADLIRNAALSYNENKNNPNIGVANSQEYYNEQLRRLGMDQNQAVHVWQQVLLFRRLFNDIGQSVFVDSLTTKNFNEYANEALTVEAYHLPKELQFADYKTMQKFEIYLSLIAKPPKDSTQLPETLLSVDEVSKRHPELVQKRYLIKLAETNKNQLLSKISLKETWNFEVDHWDLLKEKFPELGMKNADTRDERFSALDSLDDKTRLRVDTFARNEIVDSHPEWLAEALEKARERTLPISLGKKGNGSVFKGLVNGEELTKELDKMELNTAPLRFTANSQNYYLITVLDRAPNEEILTFKEADSAGLLDPLLDETLRIYYQSKREVNNWNSFDEAKEEVADAYFAELLKAIASSSGTKDKVNGHLLSPLRFYSYMQKSLSEMKNSESNAQVSSNEPVLDMSELPASKPLNAQWQLEKIDATLHRDDGKNHELFSLPLGSWSEVITAPNGDISYLYIKNRGESDTAAIKEKLSAMQDFIGNEAKCHYMNQMMSDIKKADAITLED